MKQLTLGVTLQDRATFAAFVSPGEPLVAQALQEFSAGRGARMLFVHGARGTGKSHLLQAACAQHAGSAYFPLALLKEAGPAIFDGVEDRGFIAIDDLDVVAGDAAWERALFRLYNERESAQQQVVFAASRPPGALPWGLADLRSRLQAVLLLALASLDEEGQREALRRHAAQRGLDFPDDAVQYLLRRFPRDMHSLVAMLDQLDAASLREQRRLTVPFIREVSGAAP